MDGHSRWPAGVEPLEHTADVGIRVVADSLDSLFERAAAGMRTLIEGDEAGGPPGATTERPFTIEAEDVGALLVAWLRELLYIHEVEGHAFSGAVFERIGETALRARASFRDAGADPAREIKGVTYHGLQAERRGARWLARVIFDV